MCDCRAMALLGSWRCGGMAPVTAVLQWRDADPLGRTGEEDEEVELPFMWESNWSAWSSSDDG